jgi:hypothetical protein
MFIIKIIYDTAGCDGPWFGQLKKKLRTIKRERNFIIKLYDTAVLKPVYSIIVKSGMSVSFPSAYMYNVRTNYAVVGGGGGCVGNTDEETSSYVAFRRNIPPNWERGVSMGMHG